MNDYHDNLTADQIRKQMDYVRAELGGGVDQVVEDASSLGDVRAYVKAQPIGWLIAAAAAGYFLVPSKKNQQDGSPNNSSATNANSKQLNATTKGSLAGAAFGLATTVATRLLTQKITEAGMGMLSGNQNANFQQAPDSTTYATGNGNFQ